MVNSVRFDQGAAGSEAWPVADDYSGIEYLTDQTNSGGAAAVLTFTFTGGPVQKVWVKLLAVNADDTSSARVRTDGNDPASSIGTHIDAGVPQPISTPSTTTVKVFTPAGSTVVVWGERR